MKYLVIKEANLDDLMTKVNDPIGRGWRPQGGVCAYYDPTLLGGFHAHWAQALVKEVK